jgi:hypothetical protein
MAPCRVNIPVVIGGVYKVVYLGVHELEDTFLGCLLVTPE